MWKWNWKWGRDMDKIGNGKGNEMGRSQCLSIYWANGVKKYYMNERANLPQLTTFKYAI